MRLRIAAVLASLAFTASAAIAATEITVQPGDEGCPAQATGCYVNGANHFICTSSFCGNWNVHPK